MAAGQAAGADELGPQQQLHARGHGGQVLGRAAGHAGLRGRPAERVHRHQPVAAAVPLGHHAQPVRGCARSPPAGGGVQRPACSALPQQEGCPAQPASATPCLRTACDVVASGACADALTLPPRRHPGHRGHLPRPAGGHAEQHQLLQLQPAEHPGRLRRQQRRGRQAPPHVLRPCAPGGRVHALSRHSPGCQGRRCCEQARRSPTRPSCWTPAGSS